MRDLLSFNILLIDDDPEIHAVVEAYLKRVENCEYRVDSLFDFESALGRLRDPGYEYDAILLDYYLGDRTGIEILREIEMAPLTPPVILLTGSDDNAIDIEAMSHGASDFLVKNQINSALLDRAIRYAIEHRRNERLIVLKQREIASKLKLAALGEMASTVTHEINNPLSVIQSRAALIRALVANTPGTNSKIIESADEILSMIGRVADIKAGLKKRFENPKDTAAERVGLRRLVTEAVRLSDSRRRDARASISVSIDGDREFVCRPTEISQVLVNLIVNAADAVSSLEERWIRVEARATDEIVLISITDSGHGIEEERANRLFESFFTTKSEGMGIGLSLSRKIVESHGGTLSLDGAAKHTRFVVRLPNRPVPMQFSSLKFLVVDDEREILELVREAIERRGHQAVLSADPVEARALLEREDFDVVISDIRLPNMSGIRFSEELRRSRSKEAVLIFISGFIEGDLRRKLEREPNIGFFEKPFDIDQLVSRAVQMSGRPTADRVPVETS